MDNDAKAYRTQYPGTPGHQSPLYTDSLYMAAIRGLKPPPAGPNTASGSRVPPGHPGSRYTDPAFVTYRDSRRQDVVSIDPYDAAYHSSDPNRAPEPSRGPVEAGRAPADPWSAPAIETTGVPGPETSRSNVQTVIIDRDVLTEEIEHQELMLIRVETLVRDWGRHAEQLRRRIAVHRRAAERDPDVGRERKRTRHM